MYIIPLFTICTFWRQETGFSSTLPACLYYVALTLIVLDYGMGPYTQLNTLCDCVLNCLQFCFICWEQEVLGLSFKCSWNYCRWSCYKLLNFQNLYVQVEAFKWITVYHVHHRADIFSKYLTLIHSVSCLQEVFLCSYFKDGLVTPWLRKWLQYWGLL